MQIVSLRQVVEERQAPYGDPIDGPETVARLVAPLLADADAEKMVVLTLSTKNFVNAAHVVSVGALDASIVHPREIFKLAVLSNAAAIVIAHNHPSGDTTPSRADIAVTERLVKAGEILGIAVLDHLIIGTGYRSLRREGLGFGGSC